MRKSRARPEALPDEDIDRTEPSSGWLGRLEELVDPFRADFRRRDQVRWALVYLQGLLRPGGRKTITTISRNAILPAGLATEDVVQALQNFVNQSPWDESKVWRRHRQLSALRQGPMDGMFVVQDLAFLKQGRHSVGVQRQYSAMLGRKTSCQIVLALFYVSEAGVTPLGLRLYLPRSWLQDTDRLKATGAPAEYQQAQTRGGVARDLLAQAWSDGWRADLVLGSPGLASDAVFQEELSRHALHFALAGGNEADGPVGQARARKASERVEQAKRILYDELGLADFEGRSWRGLHHHACLVMLAYSCRQVSTPSSSCLDGSPCTDKQDPSGASL